MAKYKDYKNSKYEEMLLKDYSYNYGISEEKIAKFIVNSGSSSFQKNIVDYYGLTYDNLLSTYIPELKAQLNGGYVFFLLYSFTEGGGAGNWINHEPSNTGGTALADLQDDCEYLNSIDVGDYPVCKSAPEVLDWTPYVDDVAGSTDKVFAKMTKGTLGLMWMVSTMAGNAWVWGTQWSLAHQGNPPNFSNGNPYDIYIGTIIDLGGKFNDEDKPTDSIIEKPSKPNENNGGGSSSGGGNNNNVDNTNDNNNDTSLIDKITGNITDGINEITKEIKGRLTNNLFSNNLDSSEHSNKNFIVSTIFQNMIRIKETGFFSKFVNDGINGITDFGDTDETDDTNNNGTGDDNSFVGGGGDDGDGNQTTNGGDSENNNSGNYSKPKLSGKYYIHTSYGGLNKCFLINNYGKGSVLPNCVGYAWGRSYETLGVEKGLPVSNGREWYNETSLPKGSSPKKGAIACYNGGEFGHVAFVEKIKSNGNIVFSQSNYGDSTTYGYTTFESSPSGESYFYGLTLQGYIYPEEG